MILEKPWYNSHVLPAPPPPNRASEAVSAEVRRARKALGLTVAALARRCAKLGAPELTEGALYVLEGPRPRKVTVDELVTLSAALEVHPMALLRLVPGAEAQVRDPRVANSLALAVVETVRALVAEVAAAQLPERGKGGPQ
jgi:hypothetical protein